MIRSRHCVTECNTLFCSMQMGNIAAMLAAREGHEAVVALLEKAQVERTAGGGDKTSLAK